MNQLSHRDHPEYIQSHSVARAMLAQQANWHDWQQANSHPHQHIADNVDMTDTYGGSLESKYERINAEHVQTLIEDQLCVFHHLAEEALSRHRVQAIDAEELAKRIEKISLTLRHLHAISSRDAQSADTQEAFERHNEIAHNIRITHDKIATLVHNHAVEHDDVDSQIIRPFEEVQHLLLPAQNLAANDNDASQAARLIDNTSGTIAAGASI